MDARDDEERSSNPTPGMVEVTRTSDMTKARLLAGYLESHGITTHIPDEAMIGMLDGAAVIWDEGISIEVPEELLDEASDLLAERQAELEAEADEGEEPFEDVDDFDDED